MRLSIENFWVGRVSSDEDINFSHKLPGWHRHIEGLETFCEAPLTVSGRFGDFPDVEECEVILVSAPGAVGKTTLARQIAAKANSIYLDLSEADPVGGNTLSGGLAKTGVFPDWQRGVATILVDGLDEARIKVTQKAFEAFIDDIVHISSGRSKPTVLFGRSGAIEEAWLLLDGRVKICIVEIGYYGKQDAINFASVHLASSIPDSPHMTVARTAVEMILEHLREDTEHDGDRFSGYAPVLVAVAEHVAKEPNPGALVARIAQGEEPVTLQGIVQKILEREQGKISSIPIQNQEIKTTLYTPQEQLARIVARVYGAVIPPLPMMSPQDEQAYAEALETWVPEHPFLDGGTKAASTVFEAAIAAFALVNGLAAESALSRELGKGSAANPFLAEFYVHFSMSGMLPAEHIGAVYASIRSRLSLDDQASLSIEGVEEGDEAELLRSEVEISISRSDTKRTRSWAFESDQSGSLKLGKYLEDIDINAPFSHVELGHGDEVVLVCPVVIQAEKISILASRVIVEAQSTNGAGAAFLEAVEAETSRVSSPAVVNGNATLSVAWPNSNAFPWSNFATHPTIVQDSRVEEALRRFRKFIIAFRSHSKGSLKRYAAKLEHARMTKGSGKDVLGLLVSAEILTSDGTMYTLHPERLSELTSVSYSMCVARNFPQKAVEFISRIFV